MSRYSKPRQYLFWDTDELMCLKMLVYVLRNHEASCRNRYELWARVTEILPSIYHAVLGYSKSFEQLRQETFKRTNIKITPNRLYQRSDKTGRYKEFNIYLSCVEAAYRALTNKSEENTVTHRRTFTDAQVKSALLKQGGICFYCKCPCSEGVVGDHKIPYSEGGPTEEFNCAAACVRCNSEKGAMSVFEYGKLFGERNARGRKL